MGTFYIIEFEGFSLYLDHNVNSKNKFDKINLELVK